MSELTTVEILEAALERLGPNGERWFQGDANGPNGSRCALGAIDDGGRIEFSGPIFSALTGMLEEAIGGTAVVPWNDDPSRTFEDVRAAFQKAIRSEKRKAAEAVGVDLGGEVPEVGSRACLPPGEAAELSAAVTD